MKAIDRIKEFQRFGSILGLERMETLMEKLGNPQERLQVIHVAGTNGKGSVCKFLYEGLRANGYRTGLFISPYIERFNERIQMDGAEISDEELALYTERVLGFVSEMREEGYDSPTEFEIITAIALVYFDEKKTDLVVLEVGLGGKGDSTNIIQTPILSVITSVSYDHMEQLGGTLAEIAEEKAGIIKAGVPVVSGAAEQEAARVIASKAYQKGCVLYDAAKLFHKTSVNTVDEICFSTTIYETDYRDVKLSMVGLHQIENAKIALTAIEILRKAGIITVTKDKLYEGIAKAKQPSRFEVVGREPFVILDGAHNEAGASALRESVETYFPESRIRILAGMLADKETEKIIGHLLRISNTFVATEPNNSRKLPAGDLCAMLKARGADCQCSEDPSEAYRLIRQQAEAEDVVIIAGSLYLTGALRRELQHGKAGN